jgi:AraC-like DNA-binding protein
MKITPSQLYLWDKRTLYIGPVSEPIDLSQGAATLTIALTGSMYFKTPGMTSSVECKSSLLPPGLNVSVDTKDAVIANCNLDPLGADWAALQEQMLDEKNGVAYNIKNESFYRESFLRMYNDQLDGKTAYPLLKDMLDYAVAHQANLHKVDQRIIDIIDNIKSNIDDNLTIESLAQSVNLSVPRLIQLFKQQTGVPIRRFRLWHRLFVTSVRMAEGKTLTEAAMAAGFSDSAHFTHTFRSMLGMKPSVILSQPNHIRINVS